MTLGRPFAVTAWLFSVLITWAAPDAYPTVSIGLLVLAIASAGQRSVIWAIFGGSLLILFGTSGTVEYFGVNIISSRSAATAMVFAAFMGLGAFLIQRPAKASPRQFVGSNRLTLVLSLLACVLLLLRYTSGVPLLSGDSGRLSGVALINPYLGLVSGVLPIVVTFSAGNRTRMVTGLHVLLILLVLGTGSRLLLGAVVLGFLARSSFGSWKSLRFRSRVYLAVVGALGVFGVIRIYAIRTDQSIVETFAARAGNLSGIAGTLVNWFGSSIYFSSRNGPVMFELMQKYHLNPPHGFILGGILNVLRLGDDPERWLTASLGLDLSAVGAVATPIWSGATRDFGVPFALIFALALGGVISFAIRQFPELSLWAAFSVILSFYGSYLVSAQFLLSSVLLVILIFLGRETVRLCPPVTNSSARLGSTVESK